MTFHKDQIVTNEDWQRRHEGHDVVDQVDEYDLAEGKAVKRMHHWLCRTCSKRHLHKMETVEL